MRKKGRRLNREEKIFQVNLQRKLTFQTDGTSIIKLTDGTSTVQWTDV